MQLGIRKVALRFVIGGLLHRLRGFAAPFRARPLAFSIRGGAALTLGVRFRLGPRLQASHRGLNPHQTLLSARQLSGQFIPATAAQDSVLRLVLLVCLRHQGLNIFAHALDCLLHIPITHRLVPRRIALDFRAIGRDVPQLHQPGFSRQTHYVYKYVCERLQMLLPEIADRPKVWALGAHDGEEGQIAFAGQGDLAARKDPHAVGIQQQADHHRRVKWGRASGFVLIGRIDTA